MLQFLLVVVQRRPTTTLKSFGKSFHLILLDRFQLLFDAGELFFAGCIGSIHSHRGAQILACLVQISQFAVRDGTAVQGFDMSRSIVVVVFVVVVFQYINGFSGNFGTDTVLLAFEKHRAEIGVECHQQCLDLFISRIVVVEFLERGHPTSVRACCLFEFTFFEFLIALLFQVGRLD